MENLETKIDRRVQRTRKSLRSALLELIVEKGYDTLSIQTIAERANVRRATFYLHYRDKEDLLVDTLAEVIGELAQDIGQRMSNDEAYRVLLQHVEKHPALYRDVFTSRDGLRFARQLRESMAGQVLRGMEQANVKPSVPPVVMAHFMAGVEMSMLTWWLENNRPFTADEMADYVYSLVLGGVARAIGVNIDRASRQGR